MKFQIKSRWTNEVKFECELSAEMAEKPLSVQRGHVIKKALKSGSNLRDSDLRGSDLSYTNLRGSDLRGSDLSYTNLRGSDLSYTNLRGSELSGSDLSGSNLRDTNLRGSDLSYTNLRGSDLSRSDLRDSDLRGSDLSRSDLRGSNLRDSDLSGSDLRDSDLRGSDLSYTNLRGSELSYTNLRGSDLRGIKQDLIAEILRLPAELEYLRDALIAGKVNGSTYSGTCACLAGTLAKARGLDAYNGACIPVNGFVFVADANSPREKWFLAIREGDTPETNPVSAISLEWVNEAIAIRDNIMKVMSAK